MDYTSGKDKPCRFLFEVRITFLKALNTLQSLFDVIYMMGTYHNRIPMDAVHHECLHNMYESFQLLTLQVYHHLNHVPT